MGNGHPFGSSGTRNGRLEVFSKGRRWLCVWESTPVWGFIPVFLVAPHIRLVALPYQGESQEVIAAIIGWGHWVKRRRTFGDTGSRAKWNQKCYRMKSNVFLYFEKLTFSMENYTLTFRLARLKCLVVDNRSNTKGSSEWKKLSPKVRFGHLIQKC